jgi:LacI family transcriptional regulator
MDREASRRGYLLLLSNLHARGEQAPNAVRAMRGRVDALILMAPHLSAEELAESLPSGLRAMLINTRDRTGQHPTIRLDNRAGVRTVVDHLAALGRKRLVHISGPAENIDAQERAAAFRDAALAHNLAFEVLAGDFQGPSGEAAVHTLLARGDKFDAVFAANDNMAIGALQALRDVGLDVPGEVAVAGFDDIPLARHFGLTTVRVRIAELGERAMASLLDGLASDSGWRDELHAPELVVRETTDPDAGNA